MSPDKSQTFTRWSAAKSDTTAVWPRSRRGHSLAGHDRSLYLFGGYVDLCGSPFELWRFDIPKNQWILLDEGSSSNLPVGRHLQSMTIFNGTIYIYGGQRNQETLSDFWSYDIETRKWRQLKAKAPPGARHSHSATLVGTRWMMFGGDDPVGRHLHDLWAFDFATLTWTHLRTDLPYTCPNRWGTLISLDRPGNQSWHHQSQLFKRSPEYQGNKEMEVEHSLINAPPTQNRKEELKQTRLVSPPGSRHTRGQKSADSGYSTQTQLSRVNDDRWAQSTEMLLGRTNRMSIDSDMYVTNPAFEPEPEDFPLPEESDSITPNKSPVPFELPGSVPDLDLCMMTLPAITPRTSRVPYSGSQEEMIEMSQFYSCNTGRSQSAAEIELRKKISRAMSEELLQVEGTREPVESLVVPDREHDRTLCAHAHGGAGCEQMMLLGGDLLKGIKGDNSFAFQSLSMILGCLSRRGP